jgi:alkylhydroperoxidase/carboxymuconolactone decarboxylase family protein YurZ
VAEQSRDLRRLALNDETVTESLLGVRARLDHACGLPIKRAALVRLGALAALDAATATWMWAAELALAAGATEEEIVGTLIDAAPAVGLARVVVAAPRLALALGYDVGLAPD